MDLTTDERNLLEMVRSMLDETEFAIDVPQSQTQSQTQSTFDTQDAANLEEERKNIKRLGAAVVRLWAETFKGTHVFAIVRVVGSALEVYAEMLERECL